MAAVVVAVIYHCWFVLHISNISNRMVPLRMTCCKDTAKNAFP